MKITINQLKELIKKQIQEGRMNIPGIENVQKMLGNIDKKNAYMVLNKLGYLGGEQEGEKVDFKLLTRMHDHKTKIVMTKKMSTDKAVQKALEDIKKYKPSINNDQLEKELKDSAMEYLTTESENIEKIIQKVEEITKKSPQNVRLATLKLFLTEHNREITKLKIKIEGF